MSASIRLKIRRYAPEFADETLYPDAVLDEWISDALCDVPVAKLGKNADRATAYYTAHLMTQASSATSATGGAVTKEKVGDVEISYSASSDTAGGGGPNKYYDM